MTHVDIGTAALLNGAALPAALLPPLDATPARPSDRPRRRSPIRAHPPEVRERVRLLYEGTTKTISEISAETGVSRSTIMAWAKQDGWTRPPGAEPPRMRIGPDRHRRLTERLFQVFGRQLATLEKRSGKDAAAEERDARTLAVLAKTLDTMIALDRDDGAKKPESVDRGDYKAELARTLSRWAEEGRRPG